MEEEDDHEDTGFDNFRFRSMSVIRYEDELVEKNRDFIIKELGSEEENKEDYKEEEEE